MKEILQHWEFFAFLAGWVVTCITGAVALKHRVDTNEAAVERAFMAIAKLELDHEKLETKVAVMDSDTMKELRRMGESLARIEGVLDQALKKGTS